MFMVWQRDAGEPRLFCQVADFEIRPVISFIISLGIEESGVEWVEKRKNERKQSCLQGALLTLFDLVSPFACC